MTRNWSKRCHTKILSDGSNISAIVIANTVTPYVGISATTTQGIRAYVKVSG